MEDTSLFNMFSLKELYTNEDDPCELPNFILEAFSVSTGFFFFLIFESPEATLDTSTSEPISRETFLICR
jgi:hypothetical protein